MSQAESSQPESSQEEISSQDGVKAKKPRTAAMMASVVSENAGDVVYAFELVDRKFQDFLSAAEKLKYMTADSIALTDRHGDRVSEVMMTVPFCSL